MSSASMVKPLSKEELEKKFNEIVKEHGKPNGDIVLFEQLTSRILITFCNYHQAYIIYQNDEFKVLSPYDITWTVQFNYKFVGCVTAKDWVTHEQKEILQELGKEYHFIRGEKMKYSHEDERFRKVATPITVREYLNTLSAEEFAQALILAVSHLECRYMDTELDASDVAFSVEYDMIEWLDSPYFEDKELLPSINLPSIYNDDEECEDLD